MGRENKGHWKGSISDIHMNMGCSAQAGIVTGIAKILCWGWHHCITVASVSQFPAEDSQSSLQHAKFVFSCCRLYWGPEIDKSVLIWLIALWIIVWPMRSWQKPAFRQLLPCVVQYLESSFHLQPTSLYQGAVCFKLMQAAFLSNWCRGTLHGLRWCSLKGGWQRSSEWGRESRLDGEYLCQGIAEIAGWVWYSTASSSLGS